MSRIRNKRRNAELEKRLKEEAEEICGKPEKPDLDDEIIAVIKWVDGTVIDSVRKVKK